MEKVSGILRSRASVPLPWHECFWIARGGLHKTGCREVSSISQKEKFVRTLSNKNTYLLDRNHQALAVTAVGSNVTVDLYVTSS